MPTEAAHWFQAGLRVGVILCSLAVLAPILAAIYLILHSLFSDE